MNIKNNIWYEKHRQKDINDLVLTQSDRVIFESFIKNEDIPHLLFYGPPGSGKTTLSTILIDNIAGSSLALNASSADRGIATIRGKIVQFASSSTIDNKIKIIFMDEADGLTLEAQEALKNTIEKYSKHCKFIFTANNFSKIHNALKSRCMPFQFSSFDRESLFDFCIDILDIEKIKFKDSDVELIIDRLYPDIRSIINSLQKCSITGVLDPLNGNSFNLNEKQITEFIINGNIKLLRSEWAGSGVFDWIYKILFNNFIQTLNSKYQAEVALIIAEHYAKDSIVADKEINVSACIISIMLEIGVDPIF